MKRHLAIYVEEHEFTRLKNEALRRRISLSRCVHERLMQERAAQEGELEDLPQRPPASAAVDIVALRKAIAEAVKPLSQQIGILTAMLDQFVLATLINTPEIPEHQKEQIIAAGERRYRGWERAVQELVERMHAEVGAERRMSVSNGAQA